jgi:protein-L-isoaspartate(D-aspartate) O-methyltransferase
MDELPQNPCVGDQEIQDRRREWMVRDQLAAPGRDIRSPRVLDAMRRVPRHGFVPDSLLACAYSDRPLPIGGGQTISQPFIVALMTEALDLHPGERVLEIGTGSGYQTAVLAALGVEVFSIEIIPDLGRQAEKVLRRLGYPSVHLKIGDGFDGWPEAAPFDAILAACAPIEVPSAWAAQLRDGGRMILPIGGRESQQLVLLKKSGNALTRTRVLAVRFVPMTGRAAGTE